MGEEQGVSTIFGGVACGMLLLASQTGSLGVQNAMRESRKAHPSSADKTSRMQRAISTA